MGKQTKSIITLNIKFLIKELNKALADEFLAAYQYWIGAKILKGAFRSVIQKELEEHAKQEYEHAEKIANRIIQLDGTPITSPKEWYKLTNCGYIEPKDFDSIEILKQNLEGERCAIKFYKSLLKKLKDKDEITYLMIADILKEEIEHECDLETILQDFEFCCK